jgi:phospholipid transport system substrate-binding protein
MMKIIIFTLLICLVAPLSAFAGAALDTVKKHMDGMLEVMRVTTASDESARKAKKDRIRRIADKMFDMEELSKRTLARNWSKFDSGQQKEFIRLFKALLADTYADRIFSYTNEKIVFDKEAPLTAETVEVRSKVIGKAAMSVNYRMILKAGGWMVYDVNIEGVSLVNNYRSQFREALRNKSPEELLKILRDKAAKRGKRLTRKQE